jgi:hypothetical protein
MSSVGIMASAASVGVGTVIPTAILVEPFNNLTAAPWTTVSGTPVITTGRTSVGLQFSSGGQISYTLSAANESDVVTLGCAFRVSSLISVRLFELRSDTGATLHTNLQLDVNGALNVTRSTSVQIAATAPGVIAINTWYYLELQYKLGDSPTGAATVRVNGTNVHNLTSIDTRNAGTKTKYDQLRLSGGAGATWNYDDLYVKVGAGQAFEGDTAIT